MNMECIPKHKPTPDVNFNLTYNLYVTEITDKLFFFRSKIIIENSEKQIIHIFGTGDRSIVTKN